MWNWLKNSIVASVQEETDEREQDESFFEETLLLTNIVTGDE